MIDVSVVVPVYNKGPYLPELIDSLRAQTSDSFEVWLIDDGSTDGSQRLCDEAAAADPRFRVIHQTNSGWPGRPRNAGIDASTGRYLFFADADDWCEPTLLADLVHFADEHASDVVLPAVSAEGHSYTTREPVLEDAVELDPREAFLSLTPHKLFRRSYFEGLGLRFTEERVPLEDGQLVARAYTGGGRISRFGQRLGYHYMGREGTNISYAPRDPMAHGRSIANIMISARKVAEHSDEIIVDMYRRKLLRYLGPRYLPDMPAERQAAYVQATADIAEQFIPVDLESTLTAWPRLSSRTARLREPEVSVALAVARAEGSIPAERANGHWFIGPVPADDIVVVRPRARKDPAKGVRVVSRPEWVRVTTPRLEFRTADRVVAADDSLRPQGRLGDHATAVACWDDLEVPIGFDGEPVVINRLRYSADSQGQLIVSGV
ncbi:MAG: glycosyltransferase family 2 protein [Candidatus Nanopelagicales bacterium]